MDYLEAMTKLGARTSRKLQNHTYLQRRGDNLAVLFLQTDVLTFEPRGRVILQSGGWKTVTTKDRINTYLPAGWSLSTEKGVWYLTGDNARYPYADGMSIYRGKVTGAAPMPKHLDKHKREISRYATNYTAALLAGKVPKPSTGDCWYCMTREVKTGKPLGEVTRNADHIRLHLEEDYFVPSMAVNAVEMFGASIFLKGCLGQVWNGETLEQFSRDHVSRELPRLIRRYVGRQLGYQV